jgi:hypothetical protein
VWSNNIQLGTLQIPQVILSHEGKSDLRGTTEEWKNLLYGILLLKPQLCKNALARKEKAAAL